MRVLAIETSSVAGGVAACEDDRILKEILLGQGLEHGKELIPAMDRLLREVGWKSWSVELLVVDVGPGSYTGLRVGITCAKQFVVITGCDCVQVCSTDAIAENTPSTARDVCVVIDAKWQQVYGALYQEDTDRKAEIPRFSRYHGPVVLSPEELVQKIPNRCWIVGDGISRYRNQFTKSGVRFAAQKRWFPRPGIVGLLGFKRYISHGGDDVERLSPLYLRPSAAERNAAGRRA